MICIPHQYSGDKIKKNEMGGACSAYGVEERRMQGLRIFRPKMGEVREE